MTIDELPTWEECRDACAVGLASPLWAFIYANEPPVEHEAEFRRGLAAMLTEARHAGAAEMKVRAIAALEAPITIAYGPRHGIVAKARGEFQRAIGRLPAEQPK